MRTIEIDVKVSDRGCYTLTIDKDQYFKEGYVPDFMPEEHYGDYLRLTIDIDTGKVVNWKKPTIRQLQVFIDESDNSND